MKCAAIIITEAKVVDYTAYNPDGGYVEWDKVSATERLLTDLRTLITAGERYHGTEIDARRAAARVRELLPGGDEE